MLVCILTTLKPLNSRRLGSRFKSATCYRLMEGPAWQRLNVRGFTDADLYLVYCALPVPIYQSLSSHCYQGLNFQLSKDRRLIFGFFDTHIKTANELEKHLNRTQVLLVFNSLRISWIWSQGPSLEPQN